MDSGVHYGTLRGRRFEMDRRLAETEAVIRNRNCARCARRSLPVFNGPSVRPARRSFTVIKTAGEVAGASRTPVLSVGAKVFLPPRYANPFLTFSGGE